MKYYVTFSCGHEGEVNLYGKAAERDRRIAWYEKEGICPDCYRKRCEVQYMMSTIRQIIQHIDAALQSVYGGTLPAALQEKYQELTVAMTVDSKVFFYNADALFAMTSYEIDLELTCAPNGSVAETFLYQAIKLHSNAAWDNLELQAADLAENPNTTDRDWAELFSDELYDCGYVKASLKYCRWKEER